MEISILRPAGALGAFVRPVTLDDTRYLLRVRPSARPGRGIFISLLDIAGAPLVSSIGLVVNVADLLAPFRARVLALPPGVLRCVAERDPTAADLTVEGRVRLLYGE